MKVIRIRGEVQWQVHEDPASLRWVGICNALGVTAEGQTWKELTETSQEIMEHLLTSLLKDGQLQDFLMDRGWQVQEPLPVQIPAEGVEFDLPAPFILESSRDAALA